MFCKKCGAQLNDDHAFRAAGELPAAPQVSDKKRIVALLLAIFLGQLGIHNFYLGYTKKGVIQLCVSLLLS